MNPWAEEEGTLSVVDKGHEHDDLAVWGDELDSSEYNSGGGVGEWAEEVGPDNEVRSEQGLESDNFTELNRELPHENIGLGILTDLRGDSDGISVAFSDRPSNSPEDVSNNLSETSQSEEAHNTSDKNTIKEMASVESATLETSLTNHEVDETDSDDDGFGDFNEGVNKHEEFDSVDDFDNNFTSHQPVEPTAADANPDIRNQTISFHKPLHSLIENLYSDEKHLKEPKDTSVPLSILDLSVPNSPYTPRKLYNEFNRPTRQFIAVESKPEPIVRWDQSAVSKELSSILQNWKQKGYHLNQLDRFGWNSINRRSRPPRPPPVLTICSNSSVKPGSVISPLNPTSRTDDIDSEGHTHARDNRQTHANSHNDKQTHSHSNQIHRQASPAENLRVNNTHPSKTPVEPSSPNIHSHHLHANLQFSSPPGTPYESLFQMLSSPHSSKSNSIRTLSPPQSRKTSPEALAANDSVSPLQTPSTDYMPTLPPKEKVSPSNTSTDNLTTASTNHSYDFSIFEGPVNPVNISSNIDPIVSTESTKSTASIDFSMFQSPISKPQSLKSPKSPLPPKPPSSIASTPSPTLSSSHQPAGPSKSPLSPSLATSSVYMPPTLSKPNHFASTKTSPPPSVNFGPIVRPTDNEETTIDRIVSSLPDLSFML